MAKNKQPTLVPANLSIQQQKITIPKIERRIARLKNFDVSSVNDFSTSEVLGKDLETFLQDIYGPNTIELDRYQDVCYFGPSSFSLDGVTVYEIRESLTRSINTAVATLESIMECFRESISDAELDKASNVLKGGFKHEVQHTIIRKAAK